MKAVLKSIAEALALILFVPQIFVLLYFFWGAVRAGYDSWGMMRSLVLFGLVVSRMAGPFLYLLYLLVRRVNRERRRGLATFVICLVAGYGGVVAWNLVIFENFSYVWSVLPVAACSGGAAARVAFRGTGLFVPKRRGDLFLAGD